MKKPNITPVPWQTNGNGEIFRWGNGPETKGYYPRIAKVSIWKDNNAMGSANAEAIKAVPEMIDALAMVWEVLKSKDDWGEDLSPSQIEKIYNALEKAGVKL